MPDSLQRRMKVRAGKTFPSRLHRGAMPLVFALIRLPERKNVMKYER